VCMVLNVTQMEFKPAREKAKGGLFLSPADSLPANSLSDHPPAESRARALLKSRTPNAYSSSQQGTLSAARTPHNPGPTCAPLIRTAPNYAKPFYRAAAVSISYKQPPPTNLANSIMISSKMPN
jgi:hypothetical protein